MKNGKELKQILLLALKISVGSSAAIYIAQRLGLEYAVSAGTITLLTLLATKWETVRLSVFRIITFVLSIALSWLAFAHIDSTWLSYGIFVFTMVFLCEKMGRRATISVNAVVGAHLLTSHNFTSASIWNEFQLVIIGVSIAVLLNLFQDNRNHKKYIITNMRHTEHQLQSIMRELAAYLSNQEMQQNVWEDICLLEEELHRFTREAYEYQENTFQSHPVYYIEYFQMRTGQCRILHNLHAEMKKIRTMPRQAKIIADYMLYLVEYVVEVNEPSEQIHRLHGIFENMKVEELPKTREEFESRAVLYHILMDIEDFLLYKSRFVKGLDERQLKKYWRYGNHK